MIMFNPEYKQYGLVLEVREMNGVYVQNAYYKFGHLICTGIVVNEDQEPYDFDVSNRSQWFFPKDGKWYTDNSKHSPTDHLCYDAVDCLLTELKNNIDDYYQHDSLPDIEFDSIQYEAFKHYDWWDSKMNPPLIGNMNF